MIRGSTYICSYVDAEPVFTVHPVVVKKNRTLAGLPCVGISNPRDMPLYLNRLA
jgi:hypothetical protein